MKKFLSVIALLAFSTPAVSGFVEGEAAFNQQHYSQAFSEFLPIANAGDFRSQYYIGYLYLNGYGVAQDSQEAIRYLKKSADQNYDMAQSLLAFLYNEGQVMPKDKKLALNLYKKAAAQNNISANLNLGVMYYTGDGVTRDYAKAIEYFKKVPIESQPIVSRYLGDIYLNNSELRDYKQAIKYYTISATNNDLNSFFALGRIYHQGLGTPQDMTQAIKYYKYAASQNDAASQYMLGIIYANGEGVTKDNYKAYAWLSLAVEQKQANAEIALNQLTDKMSLSDLEQARRQVLLIQQNEMGKIESPIKPETKIEATSSGSSQTTSSRRRRSSARRRHK